MSLPASGAARRALLLVDDDVLILGLLNRVLTLAGYEVRVATSGAMALELLASGARAPDLALLDVSMPGMSGLELAEQLQAHGAIAVMFLSAEDDQATVRAAIDGGAVGYLVKPIDITRIVPSVQAGLARADELRELRGSESRLTLALQQGREVGMAVGILMERNKTDRETAFRTLREHARSHQRKLNDVAGDVLQATEALNLIGGRAQK
ncbi:response regulator [Massilia sp. CCM 9210]|uniref:ANTAR domain-containing response regulator n=1 Tax=Massilia scottii TaxID=3057166 RepID=UPI00279645EB|nr:response regulator [Massilia sp. CCM 9210]MDQ1814005.1 response regulator [Massilia sp. CCM 9210]